MHDVAFNRIELLEDKPLVGMRATMSLSSDATPALWQGFMPRRGEIANSVGGAFYSVQNFNGIDSFEAFTPVTVFEKWAAVEVEGDDAPPAGMERLLLQGGHYAVFDHRGPPSEFPKTLQFIYTEWMPGAEWQLDGREHFEVLQPGWRADDPEAQEEVWIPVRQRENRRGARYDS